MIVLITTVRLPSNKRFFVRHSRFKGFIKDFPTGRIDRAEFQRIYRQFFPFGDPTSFANYLFAVFDRDGNDLVDFKEFICALSITSRGQLNEKLECKWKCLIIK